jgi:predicted PhzF superfamily epimerase YddE/YHI9
MGALAPFWSAKTGQTEFLSHQVSKREGVLHVALRNNRVEIGGKAVTVFKAEMFAL